MPWPDIFFKARKRPAPPVASEPAAETPAGSIAAEPAPAPVAAAEPPPLPISKPPPLRGTPASGTASLPPPPLAKEAAPSERETRTIPVVHGVVLRPPTGRLTRAASGGAPASTPPPKPLKNIEQLMAEADPVRALSQSGGLRMVRRVSPETLARDAQVPAPGPSVVPVKTEVVSAPAAPAPVAPPALPSPPPSAPATEPAARPAPAPSPWPSFSPKAPTPIEMKKIDFQAEPALRADPPAKVEPARATAPPRAVPAFSTASSLATAKPLEAPLRTTVSLTSSRPGVVGPPPMISIVGRRAKMADVARIVLPPKREETQSLPAGLPESTPTVVPPSFPVAGATGRILGKSNPSRPDLAAVAAALESPFMDRTSRAEPKPDTAKLPEPRPDATKTPERKAEAGKVSDTKPETTKLPEPKPEPAKIPEAAPETAKLPELKPEALPPSPPAAEGPAEEPSISPAPSSAVQTDLPLTESKLEAKALEAAPGDVAAPSLPAPPPAPDPAPRVDPQAHAASAAPASETEPPPVLDPEAHKPPAAVSKEEDPSAKGASTSPPAAETRSKMPVDKPIDLSAAELVPALAVLEPQVDAAAHRASPTPATAEPEPKVDPEAHKPKPAEIVLKPELREFHLTNGERVAGVVLSETPEAVYVEHATLGVLTIPRGEIAKRLVEIILLNGDRIVGDIMAETADMLYVRHASLGMLSVPRAQRSTRVVEAILKEGDRILGELLAETEAFTVIKSSTLGTVTVPHDKIAMLNRKVEQIEMKTLNAGPPQLRG